MIVEAGINIGFSIYLNSIDILFINIFWTVFRPGARVKRSTILEGSRLGAHSWLNSSIIGWQSTVGKWVCVADYFVLVWLAIQS